MYKYKHQQEKPQSEENGLLFTGKLDERSVQDNDCSSYEEGKEFLLHIASCQASEVRSLVAHIILVDVAMHLIEDSMFSYAYWQEHRLTKYCSSCKSLLDSILKWVRCHIVNP